MGTLEFNNMRVSDQHTYVPGYYFTITWMQGDGDHYPCEKIMCPLDKPEEADEFAGVLVGLEKLSGIPYDGCPLWVGDREREQEDRAGIPGYLKFFEEYFDDEDPLAALQPEKPCDWSGLSWPSDGEGTDTGASLDSVEVQYCDPTGRWHEVQLIRRDQNGVPT
jgi:hypothetical protein